MPSFRFIYVSELHVRSAPRRAEWAVCRRRTWHMFFLCHAAAVEFACARALCAVISASFHASVPCPGRINMATLCIFRQWPFSFRAIPSHCPCDLDIAGSCLALHVLRGGGLPSPIGSNCSMCCAVHQSSKVKRNLECRSLFCTEHINFEQVKEG